MTFRAFLWSIGLLTLGALGVFLATLFFVAPDESGLFGRVLFFGSAFVVMIGIFTIILSEIYGRIFGSDLSSRTGVIFRQGMFFGGYSTLLFLFQYWKVFFWWTALLLLVAFLLIELSCREWIDEKS